MRPERVGRHDAERLAAIVVSVATPLQPVDMPELSRDIDELLDTYAGVPLGELSLRAVFASITEAVARHRLRLPADLLLLVKSVSVIEAVGRDLDPSFEIVRHATPLVESLVAERSGPGSLARRAAEAGRETAGALRMLAGIHEVESSVVRPLRAPHPAFRGQAWQ